MIKRNRKNKSEKEGQITGFEKQMLEIPVANTRNPSTQCSLSLAENLCPALSHAQSTRWCCSSDCLGPRGDGVVCDTGDLPHKERYTASQNLLPRCRLQGFPHGKAAGECHAGVAWGSAQNHVLKLLCRVTLSLFSIIITVADLELFMGQS